MFVKLSEVTKEACYFTSLIAQSGTPPTLTPERPQTHLGLCLKIRVPGTAPEIVILHLGGGGHKAVVVLLDSSGSIVNSVQLETIKISIKRVLRELGTLEQWVFWPTSQE